MENIFEFFSYLVSSDLQSKLWWLRIIFIVLALYFVFGIFYFGIKGKYFYGKNRHRRFWKEYKGEFSASQKNEKEWNKLEKSLKSDLASEYKLAVVSAGKIFEEVLNASGSGQGSFEEKVGRVITDSEFSFDELYFAHSLWARIIADPSQSINQKDASRAFEAYNRALKQLKYF